MTTRTETAAAQNAAIWATALRLQEFSYASLAAECHIPIERATALIRGWVKLRLANYDHVGDRGRSIFKLTPAAREVHVPANMVVQEKEASAQENLWRSARMLGSFGALDLAVHSTTPTVEVTEEAATRFCQMLLKGGYLKVLRKASFRRRRASIVRTTAIYRLVRNTGPLPPVERRVAAVFDLNLGEYTYVAGAEQ